MSGETVYERLNKLEDEFAAVKKIVEDYWGVVEEDHHNSESVDSPAE